MRDSPKETSPPPETSPSPGISLQADKGEIPPEMTIAGGHPEEIQEYTLEKKLENKGLTTEINLEVEITKIQKRTPEGREGMKKEVVTLAMEGDAEGAARRP